MLKNELMHRQQVERPRIIQQLADARSDVRTVHEEAEGQKLNAQVLARRFRLLLALQPINFVDQMV